MRSARLWLVVLAAVAVVVALGLKQASDSNRAGPSAPAVPVRTQNGDRPAALAALAEQAGALLPGGLAGLRMRLRALRGHPVVVNAWASWCGPCRDELPILQRASRDWGRRVGFLGVDVRDDRAAAERLLQSIPLDYPSYEDPQGAIARSYRLVGTPSTIFFDRAGVERHVHPGPYLRRGEFDADIARYALG